MKNSWVNIAQCVLRDENENKSSYGCYLILIFFLIIHKFTKASPPPDPRYPVFSSNSEITFLVNS